MSIDSTIAPRPRGRPRTWTAEDDKLLREIWITATDEEVLSRFPAKSLGSLSKRASMLGLHRSEFPWGGNFGVRSDPLLHLRSRLQYREARKPVLALWVRLQKAMGKIKIEARRKAPAARLPSVLRQRQSAATLAVPPGYIEFDGGLVAVPPGASPQKYAHYLQKISASGKAMAIRRALPKRRLPDTELIEKIRSQLVGNL